MPSSCDHPFDQKPQTQKGSTLISPVYTTASSNLPRSPYNSHLRQYPSNQPLAIKVSDQRNGPTDRFAQQQSIREEPREEPIVKIDKINIDQKTALFQGEFELNVVYTVGRQLKSNLNWKVTYLGSAYCERFDQDLCEFQTQDKETSDVFPSRHQFKLSLQPPKYSLIPPNELFDVSAIVISASYFDHEFVKVGYYIHYQLPSLTVSQKQLISRLKSMGRASEKYDKNKKKFKTKPIRKKDPPKVDSEWERSLNHHQKNLLSEIFKGTARTFLIDKPRITYFPLEWKLLETASKDSKREALLLKSLQGPSNSSFQEQ